MKIKSAILLVVLATMIAACGSSSQATPTLPPLETETPAAAGATATAPSNGVQPTETSPAGAMTTETPGTGTMPSETPATGIMATETPGTGAMPSETPGTGTMTTTTPIPLPGTVQPTTLPPTPLPTATAGPLPSGDLTENQMAAILGSSLADYPWRMDFQSAQQPSTQGISGTIEANSSSRMEVTVEELVSGSPVSVDLIVITPTLYAKVSGIPTSILEAAGLQEGEWAEIAPGQDVLGLLNFATATSNPTSLLMGLGFQGLLAPSSGNQAPFALTGTEQVAGVDTNVYERQATGTDGSTTYRMWVGTDDSHLYKMEAEGPVNTTVTMTYDTSIDIQPPIP